MVIAKIKVGNHPHTNIILKQAIMRKRECKCRILGKHLKLRDQQLKTVFYTYRLLYQNIMGTTDQKSIHTKKKKQTKHITKDRHLMAREENKRGREEKKTSKINPKQLTKLQ